MLLCRKTGEENIRKIRISVLSGLIINGLNMPLVGGNKVYNIAKKFVGNNCVEGGNDKIGYEKCFGNYSYAKNMCL